MIQFPEDISSKLSQFIAAEVFRQQTNYQNPATLVPTAKVEPIKIVKTSSMTYSEYLTRVLKQPAALKAVGTGGRTAYRLVEDLHIINALSKQSSVTNKTFDDISRQGRINRSAESIRNRYNEVICHISEDDMRKVTEYLEKEGVEGYMSFQNEEIVISSKDPKEGSVAKRPRFDNLEIDEGAEKRSKRNVPPAVSELNDTLAVYSKTVGLTIPELLGYLDRASGDLIALDRFIETRDERLLWSEEEDALIKAGGASLEALKRYRAEKEIQARKAYLEN